MFRSFCFGAAALAAVGFLAPLPSAQASGTGRVIAYTAFSYGPEPVHVNQGDSLEFTNLDMLAGEGHSVTERAPAGEVRFDSPITKTGAKSDVVGITSLPPGTYTFMCRVHGFMKGTLIVDPAGGGR